MSSVEKRAAKSTPDTLKFPPRKFRTVLLPGGWWVGFKSILLRNGFHFEPLTPALKYYAYELCHPKES